MQTISRRTLIATSILGTLGTLTSCSRKTPAHLVSPNPSGLTPGQQGTITIWTDHAHRWGLEKTAERFHADNGIEIIFVELDLADIPANLETLTFEDSFPDIAICPNWSIGKLAQDSLISPLPLSGFAQEFLEHCAEGFRFGGADYAVPINFSCPILVSNADLVPSPPKTWDELLTIGKQLVAANRTKTAVGVGLAHTSPAKTLYPFQSSFGATLFKLDSSGVPLPKVIGMGGEAGETFANWLALQGSQEYFSLGLDQRQVMESFLVGETAFVVAEPHNLGGLLDSGIHFQVQPIPNAGLKESVCLVESNGFTLLAKASNPIAAKKFLSEYVSTDESQLEIYRQTLRLPAKLSALDSSNDSPVTTQIRAIESLSSTMPNLPQMNLIWPTWDAAVSSILTGQTSNPATTWNDFCTQAQQILA